MSTAAKSWVGSARFRFHARLGKLVSVMAVGLLFSPTMSTGQVLPAKAAESAREVLDQVGFDDAFFGKFEDNKPLSETEQQAVLKLMARVSTLRRVDQERWAKPAFSPSDAKDNSLAMRGELYLLRGVALFVTRLTLSADQQALFNLETVFLVQARLSDGVQAEIFCTTVPQAWNLNQKIAEPISAVGLYVKQLAAPDNAFVFVAERVAWNPETLLGKLAMDEGLFDAIKQRAPLLASERECFYQLLAAVGRTQPHQLDREATAQLQRVIKNYRGEESRSSAIARQLARAEEGKYDVVPLFNEPDKEVGRLVMFEGDARQAIEVHIDDEEIVERFGISRYYEITFFTDDSQQNPLVGCVLHVPAGLPLGEDISVRVRLAGFFFKSWAFPRRTSLHKETTANQGLHEQQLAPLIIGRDVSLVTTVASWPDKVLNGTIVGGILLSLLAILWAAWRSSRPAISSKNAAASPLPDFSQLDG